MSENWASERHAGFQAAIAETGQRIAEAVERDRQLDRERSPAQVVPDVRTVCCDAPVIVDPSRPGFLELVLSLVCAHCGADVGSPGLEDLDDGWFTVKLEPNSTYQLNGSVTW